MQMNGIEYARRQPEKSDLYKIVRINFQSFFVAEEKREDIFQNTYIKNLKAIQNAGF